MHNYSLGNGISAAEIAEESRRNAGKLNDIRSLVFNFSKRAETGIPEKCGYDCCLERNNFSKLGVIVRRLRYKIIVHPGK